MTFFAGKLINMYDVKTTNIIIGSRDKFADILCKLLTEEKFNTKIYQRAEQLELILNSNK
jgi:hypothetical protein